MHSEFPLVLKQLKTADHRYSNVLEPILNPTEISIQPNDRVLIRTNSLLYPENAVTGILQPSDLIHEEGDITICTALVTLTDGNIQIPVNNFTDDPNELKKRLHIANFLVMTPGQPGNYYKKLSASSRLTKFRKTLKILGFLLQKTLQTPANTRLSRKKSYANYRRYKTWRPLIPQRMRNPVQSS